MSSPIVPPPRSASALAEAMVQTTSQASVLRRWGIVHAINSNATLNVDIAGVIIPNLKRVASYEPTVGERVLIDAVGTDLTVIGATAPSPRTYNRPTGDIEATIRKTPKPDTLFLQGQTINRADYPRLFAWVQEQGLLTTTQAPNNLFGAGNGSTTFVLPDLRGHTVVGAETANPLGTKFGADSRAFTIANANMPQHNHVVSINDHASHAHVASAGNTEHEHSSAPHEHSQSGGHSHLLGNHRFVGQNAHAHVNRPGSTSEGPDLGGVGADAWTAGVGHHTHGLSGGHSHGHSGIHSHPITIGGSGAFSHSGTVSQAGGVATPTAISIDTRQRSYSVNWLIWV